MWQEIAVTIIVLAAAFFVIRRFIAQLRGTRACEIEQCTGCPFAEECDDRDKRSVKKTSGGCGCCH